MTPEQLAAARASHWRQDAQPLLTLEDATKWLEGMQLALYLPRKSQLLAPAPSFVEAVSGEGSATPSPEAIQQAQALLVRMVTEGSAVPLNLFGTPGEQPDFIVAIQALPHVAALQADRNWKKPPSRTGPGKVSPLAIEIWKLLDKEGALTANEIRAQLGHELTEAATIRGLSELWQNMRVAPLPQGAGEDAEWELLSITHKKEMASGVTLSQSAALSMLVSNYLQSIVTGTAEDIEAFLSPVASRSRLRDVIRGLTATRQLRSLSMDAQTFLFIEGTLPDMPEVVVVEGEDAPSKPAFMGRSAYRERMLNRGKEDEEKTGEDAGDSRRPPFRPSSDRPAYGRPSTGRSFADRSPGERASAPRRFAAGGAPSSFRDKPSFRDKSSFRDKPAFRDRPSASGAGAPRSGGRSSEGRPPFRRSEGSSDRSSFNRPRPGGAGGTDRPFTPRPFTPGGRPPAGGRPAFGRKPGFSKPFSSADGGRSSKPFIPRDAGDGERSSFKPRTDFGKSGGYGKDKGTRPSFGTRSGTGRPFTPREGVRPAFSDRPRPFSDRSKPFAARGGSDRGSSDRGSDDSSKNSSRAGFLSRSGSRPGRPSGDRPRPDRAAGDRPSAGRPRPPRPDGDRPSTPRPFTPPPRDGEGRPPRKFDGKLSFPKRNASTSRGGSESRPPRREGGSSGFPSNPNRPSRAPRAGGSFVKRDGPSSRPASSRPAGGMPSSGSGGRPTSSRPAARGAKPGFSSRPTSRPGGAASPGRNPGGTGRPGGPRVGGSASGRPNAGRPNTGRPGTGKPGGMKPPSRKPRPEAGESRPRREKDSE